MIETVIEFIFKFPFVLDIIIVLFLLILTSLGYSKGFWRASFRFIFVVILLVVSWIWIVDGVAKYVDEQIFVSLFGGNFRLKAHPEAGEAAGIRDLVEIFVNLSNADSSKMPPAEYLDGLSLALSKSLAWFAIVIIIQFVSWIVSAIIYFIFRHIIPKKVRKKKLRLLGALLGLLQGAVVIICLMIPMSALSPMAERINGENLEPYDFVPKWALSIVQGLNPKNSMLNPVLEWVSDLSDSMFSFTANSVAYDFRTEIIKLIDFSRGIDVEFSLDNEAYDYIASVFPHGFVNWSLN